MDLSILLIGDREMARLNWQHLAHRGTTDVLSFPLDTVDGIRAGDIAVCVPEARRNARRFGHTLHAELAFYVVHGILHLTGHDDHTPEERAQMHRRQKEILAPLGIVLRD